MQVKIRKITKKEWFYFLGAGSIVTLLFTRMFFGGVTVISLPQLESYARNAIIQTGVVNVARADTVGGGGGGGGGDGGDCDDGDGCSDGGSY